MKAEEARKIVKIRRSEDRQKLSDLFPHLMEINYINIRESARAGLNTVRLTYNYIDYYKFQHLSEFFMVYSQDEYRCLQESAEKIVLEGLIDILEEDGYTITEPSKKEYYIKW